MKFFTTDIRNVKINGIEVPNALIVNGIQDGPTQPELTFLIPEAFRGVHIMGCRYVQETKTFEVVDEEPEPTPNPERVAATKADLVQANLDQMEALSDIYIEIQNLIGGSVK